jgi:hypothetical protein
MVKATYEAAREEKGAGSGTSTGFWFANAANYQQIVVTGFDFYSECSLDFYMIAIGNNVQNPTGLSNLGTNLAFRLMTEDDTTLTDLADAITTYAGADTDANLELLGEASGNLLRIILSVEIPTTTDNDIAYY